jgi:sigma-B regulation protein RsbU (phosphoserine phosphatase)
MILVLMFVSGYFITDRFVEATTRHVLGELLVQARSFSGTAGSHIISAANPDALMLNGICKKLAADNLDVYWTGISGSDGVFLAHTDLSQVIAKMRTPSPRGRQFESLLRDGEAFELRDDTIFVSIPIAEVGIRLGTLTVASSVRRVSEARRSSILTVGSVTLFFVLLGIPLILFVSQRKLRPISLITSRLKQIDFEDMSMDMPALSRNEFGYLAETLRVMGQRLNLAKEESLERQRMSQELAIARDIQTSMLPRSYPRSDRFEFAARYESAREVGGDYFDFVDFDDRYLAVIVADVSGKSLPAMLVMLLTREIVKRATLSTRDPAGVLSAVNGELHSSIREGTFVTMFFGLLDKKLGCLEFASAGHSSVIFLEKPSGRARLVKTKGFPLGLVQPQLFEERIEEGRIEFAQDDWLILYTDGVNEAKNEAGQQFGMGRFLRLLEENASLESDELLRFVLTRHKEFVGSASQYDDITLVAMKWNGPGGRVDAAGVEERASVEK